MEHVQLRLGQEPAHDPPVHGRDDRVVVAGQDQRRLPDQLREGQAGPAGDRQLLVEVSAPVAAARVGQQGDGARVRPHRAAVDPGSHRAGVLGVLEPPPRQHLADEGRAARDHHAGGGADEDEPPAPASLLEGELLGERTTPRHAEHVGLRMAQLVEDPGDEPAHVPEPVRPARRRRPSHARHVEADDPRRRRQRVDERLQPLDRHAEAVHQEQRGSPAIALADGDAHRLAPDREGFRGRAFSGRHAGHRGRWSKAGDRAVGQRQRVALDA